eukprot:13983235-Alexandrium_andersonii.AAC.1
MVVLERGSLVGATIHAHIEHWPTLAGRASGLLVALRGRDHLEGLQRLPSWKTSVEGCPVAWQ